MQQQQRTQILEAAKAYMASHSLSQNELAKKADINQGYLSQMLAGKTEMFVNNKPTPIADKWFIQLAGVVGLQQQQAIWQPLPTLQMVRIIDTLNVSKQTGRAAMLIGPTGCGKSYATEIFCTKNPNHTYKITVSSLYRLRDIINELGELLGIEYLFTNKSKVDAICKKLIDIKRSGGNPIIIIDEGENMKLPVLHMVKALYDVLKNYCSIVIIGTEELLTKLIKLRNKKKDGIPQLYRRFKAGCVTVEPQTNFKLFFEKYAIEKGLAKLLTELCDNYGELNDYLESALKYAQSKGQELTEDMFRLLYNLPKY